VQRKPQGLAVGLVRRGLSRREPECVQNGFDRRSIYTGVRMLENSPRSAKKCQKVQSETGRPRRGVQSVSRTYINGSEMRRACPRDSKYAKFEGPAREAAIAIYLVSSISISPENEASSLMTLRGAKGDYGVMQSKGGDPSLAMTNFSIRGRLRSRLCGSGRPHGFFRILRQVERSIGRSKNDTRSSPDPARQAARRTPGCDPNPSCRDLHGCGSNVGWVSLIQGMPPDRCAGIGATYCCC
jgi:hypothetical protein